MQRQQGFTLIEILIVIVIISITITFAVLSFGDFGASRRITLAAEQFKADLQMIQQEAILDAIPYGVAFSHEGYLFVKFEDHTTQKIGRLHLFPKNSNVTWVVPKHPKNSPDIIINPAGEFSAFQLNFNNSKHKLILRIILDKQNNIQLLEPLPS